MNRPVSQPFNPDKPNAERAQGAQPLSLSALQDCIARHAAAIPGLAEIDRQLQRVLGHATSQPPHHTPASPLPSGERARERGDVRTAQTSDIAAATPSPQPSPSTGEGV